MARAGRQAGPFDLLRVHDRRGSRACSAASTSPAHPPLPMAQFAANLNVDGANYLGQTKDLVLLGSDRSSLGPLLAALAGERGRVVGAGHASRARLLLPLRSLPAGQGRACRRCRSASPSSSRAQRRRAAGEAGGLQRQGLPPAVRRVRPGVGLQRRGRRHAAAGGAGVARRRDADDARLQRRRPVRAGAEMTAASTPARDARRHPAAAERVRGTAMRTPVLPLPWPGAERRRTRSGSSARTCSRWARSRCAAPSTCWRSCRPRRRARGVITYSSGNHGQGVAMAAQALGVPAVIVMPTTAPAVKVDGVRSYGAEVIFAGTTSIDRQQRAEAEAAARGLIDHPAVRSPDGSSPGQGTRGARAARAGAGSRHRLRADGRWRDSSPAWRRRSSCRARACASSASSRRARRRCARRATPATR